MTYKETKELLLESGFDLLRVNDDPNNGEWCLFRYAIDDYDGDFKVALSTNKHETCFVRLTYTDSDGTRVFRMKLIYSPFEKSALTNNFEECYDKLLEYLEI